MSRLQMFDIASVGALNRRGRDDCYRDDNDASNSNKQNSSTMLELWRLDVRCVSRERGVTLTYWGQ